ncbi:MAG: hypothetical protein Q9181_002614 [Wetmoreana brouardii]
MVLRDKHNENVEAHEMADLNPDHILGPPEGLGVPSSKAPISWLDVAAIALALAAFTVAIAVVWYQAAATSLGQTNQLVVVGFALSIMNLSAQRQVLLAAIHVEAWYGHSKLTHFDALLRKGLLTKRLSLLPRLVLLGLSAAYKKFSGGQSMISVGCRDSHWGIISRPGWPWSGNGLSGAVDAYVPFWNHVGISRTYGYNMFVESNTTAALLDTPDLDTIQSEQNSLDLGQYILLHTTVNATVAEHKEMEPEDRIDAQFWKDLEGRGFINRTIDMIFGFFSGLYAPIERNYSEIYVFIWDSTKDTFESTAQRYIQTRRLCAGTWNISSSNVSLIEAKLLEPVDDQIVIQEMSLNIGKWFTEPLPEYNYIWYPPENLMSINTFPPLVVSMLWARLISRNSYQNVKKADQNATHAARTYYSKPARVVQKTYTSITLKRSNWLLFVLAIHPILTMLAVSVKGFLYSVPVGDDFGLVSLLSGVKKDCLDLLHGASLSGKLRDDVHVRFKVLDGLEHGDTREPPRVQMTLERFESSGASNVVGDLDRKTEYH